LGNCIGKGQFGSVYRALDLSTGEVVAIKRIKLEEGELDQEEMMVGKITVIRRRKKANHECKHREKSTS
jgi:serine/threonine protein kinase